MECCRRYQGRLSSYTGLIISQFYSLTWGGDFRAVAAGKECDVVLSWRLLAMGAYLHAKCFSLISYFAGPPDIKRQAHFLTMCWTQPTRTFAVSKVTKPESTSDAGPSRAAQFYSMLAKLSFCLKFILTPPLSKPDDPFFVRWAPPGSFNTIIR